MEAWLEREGKERHGLRVRRDTTASHDWDSKRRQGAVPETGSATASVLPMFGDQCNEAMNHACFPALAGCLWQCVFWCLEGHGEWELFAPCPVVPHPALSWLPAQSAALFYNAHSWACFLPAYSSLSSLSFSMMPSISFLLPAPHRMLPSNV